MKLNIGVIMDAIESIHLEKDSTLAMILEASDRDFNITYIRPSALFLSNDREDLKEPGVSVLASTQKLTVFKDSVLKKQKDWYKLDATKTQDLSEFDVILMRQDPPFNMSYIYITYLLEIAERNGVLVVNSPKSVRDCNEKLFATQFPECMPATCVSRLYEPIQSFHNTHKDIILKPLDGMGGTGIFRIQPQDQNLKVAFDLLSKNSSEPIMAQEYLPDITKGDKRILMIDGEPIPYALARIPAKNQLRGNLVAGGRGEGIALSDRDKWICNQVGPQLKALGLMFVGLDVIGDYLTEINVTSPTCIRELDKIYNLNIAGQLFDAIEHKIKHKMR